MRRTPRGLLIRTAKVASTRKGGFADLDKEGPKGCQRRPLALIEATVDCFLEKIDIAKHPLVNVVALLKLDNPKGIKVALVREHAVLRRFNDYDVLRGHQLEEALGIGEDATVFVTKRLCAHCAAEGHHGTLR
jgi:hypothetical protein